MEGIRAPQGLDAEDRLAFGLSAPHLAYLVVFCLAGYVTFGSRLVVPLKAPLGLLLIAGGVALAWGRIGHRPLDAWLWLALRYYARPRRSPSPAPVLDTTAAGGATGTYDAAVPVPLLASEDDEPASDGPTILALPGIDHRVAEPEPAYLAIPAEAIGPAPVFIGTTQRVAFFSLKGGVGKTTLATETAALLARLARHRGSPTAPAERLKVALLDLNLGSANVSMKLGLTHPTLWDLVMDPDPSADHIAATLIEHRDSGLNVLLGPPRAVPGGEGRSMAMQRVAAVLSHLDEQGYHFVFVDMSNEIDDFSTYLLEAVHQIYCVISPTPSGVQDTYRAVESLRRLGHRRKLRFVLNQAHGSFDADEMLGDLGMSLAATVPRDDAFLIAEERHQPAALEMRGAAYRGIFELSAAVYPALVETPPKRSVWERLKTRLG